MMRIKGVSLFLFLHQYPKLTATIFSNCISLALCFSQHKSLFINRKRAQASSIIALDANRHHNDDQQRRHFLVGAGSLLFTGASVSTAALFLPQNARAGIDVSGLRVEGGSNSIMKDQLKKIDGSASTRVNQIKELTPTTTTTTGTAIVSTIKAEEKIDSRITTWLYRTNPGISPRLSRSGTLLNLYRCDDTVVGPDDGLSSPSSVGISFEFPSDWLQLDKYQGGISYVDQRNGDRLYVLKTKLPDGERLSTVPKSFFGTSIFDPKGTIVKSQGVEIDEYKVSSSTTIDECPNATCSTHKRYKIKYSTVTGNGLRVERRALVDAYEISTKGDVYMMMTSSNAVKFDNKDSPERKTVEAIIDSFQINV